MKLKIGKTNQIVDETETDPIVCSGIKVMGVVATACQTVESQATLPLTGGNNFNITGTADVEKMTKTDYYTGGVVHLLIVDGLQFKHMAGGSGQIHLRDSIAYSAPAGTVITFGLFFNSVVSEWYEISRSEPGT